MRRSNIRVLEAELANLRKKAHNSNMRNIAKSFQADLLNRMTPAELRFKHIADKKNIKLECQHRIEIFYKGVIKRLYIVDFCDTINKIVFEIDGNYHNTEEQRKKDYKRTKDLQGLGYKVYRITNSQVYQGLSTALLCKVYHK